jgi:BA14K-like protein
MKASLAGAARLRNSQSIRLKIASLKSREPASLSNKIARHCPESGKVLMFSRDRSFEWEDSMRNVLRMVAPALFALALLGSEAANAQGVNPNCDAYARQAAASVNNAPGQVFGGALTGALGGAIIGSLAGGRRGAGTGALIGTGVGAVGGAAANNANQGNAYWAAYNDCMANQGPAPRQTVYDAADEAPEPWTDEWYDYCANKYHSFNARTGYYLTSTGQRRLCR